MEPLQQLSDERRHHCRVFLKRPAQFDHARGVATGHLVDLSFFGAMLEMDDDHALEVKSGTLVVPYSRDPQEAVQVSARVVYRRNRSVGLSWNALTPEDIIKVRRLAELEHGKPWLLMRPAHAIFWRSRTF